MKIYFASDHAGFGLKGLLIPFLKDKGFEIEDCGPTSFSDGDDYPDFVVPAVKKVAADPGSFGIVIGASGQGEAMAANRVKGVRAAVYYGDDFGAQTDTQGNVLNLLQSARAHNDANVLSLGARFVTENAARRALQIFLDTPFSGDERHMRRIAKLDA
jgi:ribose 5-phosphate isomerase B